MQPKANEAKYRGLFEGASDAILLLQDGRFVEWNSVAMDMFQCTEADLRGSRPSDLSPPTQPCGTDSRRRAGELLRCAWEGAPQRFEWVHRRRNGKPFPTEVALTRVEIEEGPCVLAVVRDITERKQVEEALRTSESKYRTFFENSCDPLIMLKGDRFVDCNAAAVRAFGFESKSQILDTHPAETSPEFQADGVSSYEKAAQMIETVHRQGSHRFEWLHVRTSGEVFPVEVAMTAMPSEDGILLLAVLREISDRVRAEKMREALEGQLRQSQKMQAVGQLAGGVAHDFNNLLQAILGYGEMAKWKVEPDRDVHGDLDEVIKAANRASDLVRQLLAFSRRQTLELEVIDLDEVIDDLSKMIRRVIGEDIEYSTVFLPGRKAVLADQGQIEQILMNLCVNGRDAMIGGGRLTISTSTTEVTEAFCEANAWARSGSYVLLTVSDTGHGMDKETRARVFEPFFTTKGEGEGTGLGLSTVYGIVRQHNGLIQVTSQPGVGTTFKVFLPEADGAPKRVAVADRLPVPRGCEMVLLAEDNDAVRGLAQKSLEGAGYTVLAAQDGREAIRLFDAHAGSVDVALLDVVMPGLGGRAVFDHIKTKGPTIPVLFTSGYSTGAVHNDFILEEGLHLLQKPYRREDLLRRVREMLDV